MQFYSQTAPIRLSAPEMIGHGYSETSFVSEIPFLPLMNLLISTNRKYLDKTETMIYSLSRFASERLFVWCLYSELSRQQRDRFSRHLYVRSKVSRVVFIDMGWVGQSEDLFPLRTPYLSRDSYSRLFAQFYLPEDLDRILWLDSDIIVKGSLQDLYSAPLNNIPLIAFSNMGEPGDNEINLGRLELSLSVPYFNAGVLLLNLKYLRTKTSLSSILELCLNNASRLRFEDQDVMNLIYHDRALVLNDQRYNCMVNAPKVFSSPDIAQKAVVIHYAGREKPWRFLWHNEFSRYWWEARREEGLRPGDRGAFLLGWLWYKLDGNRWKRPLLRPYLWLMDHWAH